MANPRNADVGFAELHTQLRIISRLLAAQLKATMGQQDLVRLLWTTGASNSEIGDVLDTTTATVATTIQRLKKKTKSYPDIGTASPGASESLADA